MYRVEDGAVLLRLIKPTANGDNKFSMYCLVDTYSVPSTVLQEIYGDSYVHTH